MRIYTLNVGQGQFVIVTGQTEGFVVDAFIPGDLSNQEPVFVKSAIAKALKDKALLGVMVTGFDDDHFCEKGLRWVLNRYNANWVVYPSYFKETDTASSCFKFLNDKYRQKTLDKVSVLLDGETWKALPARLSNDFSFEAFSPSRSGRDSSNNSSLVVKVTEKRTSATYLITGDTENSRWEGISVSFKDTVRLRSKVMAAPHHGSKNGITEPALRLIAPHTVLISAGVNNDYDHPSPAALKLFQKHARAVYQTNQGSGRSWLTEVGLGDPATSQWQP